MEMLRAFWDEAVALMPANAARDERNMPLCRRGDLVALWREADLRDVVEEALTVGNSLRLVRGLLDAVSREARACRRLRVVAAPADREALRLRLRRRLLGDGPDKAVVMHARAWAVRGTVR
jgi:hypothetical protein